MAVESAHLGLALFKRAAQKHQYTILQRSKLEPEKVRHLCEITSWTEAVREGKMNFNSIILFCR